MATPTKIDRMAVAARAESGWPCTVTVQPDPLGQGLLRYDGWETIAARLTQEVIELLTVALSMSGRSTIPAHAADGSACPLVVIGRQDGCARLYFDGRIATSAVLDATARDRLVAALKSIGNG